MNTNPIGSPLLDRVFQTLQVKTYNDLKFTFRFPHLDSFQGHGRVDFAQYLRASANSNDNYAHFTESLTQLLTWQAKRSAVSAALTFNSLGHEGGRGGGGGGRIT